MFTDRPRTKFAAILRADGRFGGMDSLGSPRCIRDRRGSPETSIRHEEVVVLVGQFRSDGLFARAFEGCVAGVADRDALTRCAKAIVESTDRSLADAGKPEVEGPMGASESRRRVSLFGELARFSSELVVCPDLEIVVFVQFREDLDLQQRRAVTLGTRMPAESIVDPSSILHSQRGCRLPPHLEQIDEVHLISKGQFLARTQIDNTSPFAQIADPILRIPLQLLRSKRTPRMKLETFRTSSPLAILQQRHKFPARRDKAVGIPVVVIQRSKVTVELETFRVEDSPGYGV